MTRRAFAVMILLVSVMPTAAAEPPKVVLIGDSIRMGYAPDVRKLLDGKAVVIDHKDNGGDSANVLKHLDEWVIREAPAVVHLNCGLHDLKYSRAARTHQVPLEQYEKNLRAIVARVRTGTRASIIFATTTPILDERHARRGASFDRFEADVKSYNAVALKVMKELNVPVNDLHAVVVNGGPEKLLGKDGTHYSPEGSKLLAEAVAQQVKRALP